MRMRQLSTAPSRQRGLSFIGLVLIGVLAVGVFAIGGQALPTYLEYKAAVIDDITTISGKDLKVTKRGDKVVVGYDYQREIHIAGPAYLTLKYAGQTQ